PSTRCTRTSTSATTRPAGVLSRAGGAAPALRNPTSRRHSASENSARPRVLHRWVPRKERQALSQLDPGFRRFQAELVRPSSSLRTTPTSQVTRRSLATNRRKCLRLMSFPRIHPRLPPTRLELAVLGSRIRRLATNNRSLLRRNDRFVSATRERAVSRPSNPTTPERTMGRYSHSRT